ncbi:MAG: cation:proton antiporter [Pseudomonadota bacterium]
MISEPIFFIAAALVAYGAASGPLGRSILSAPMAFMLAGLALGLTGLVDAPVDSGVLEAFGEVTLGLILFADAASTNARRLLKDNRLPLRLLLIGLPATIALGTGIARLIFPDLSWAACALIASILAPTDAALGVAVVSNKAVPERIRQAVLVESGLNDGLALPAVLLFAALAFSGVEAAGHGGGEAARSLAEWLRFAGVQIAVGAGVGVVGGGALGWLLVRADDRGLIEHSFRNLTTIGAALLVLIGAHFAGGNGFIATFVAGLVFGGFCRKRTGALTEFIEEEGQLFSLLIFFFFGAALLPEAIPFMTAACMTYALLSLTVIRMAPSFLALTGSGVSATGKLFIGWFGPRGLASILFLFVAVEHEEMGRLTQIEAVVYLTVFLSVLLHGATAAPLSNRYAASAAASRDG